jgi:uncharacterized membrane protein
MERMVALCNDAIILSIGAEYSQYLIPSLNTLFVVAMVIVLCRMHETILQWKYHHGGT